MKYIFSDYDGTIKTFVKNPDFFEKINLNLNKKAINGFIEQGNKFIIITGRTTESILDSASKYNINYNYIISYDGRVCIDKNKNIIYAKYLNKKAFEVIDNYKLGEIDEAWGVFGNTKNPDEVVSLIVNSNSRTVEKLKELRILYSDIEFTYYKLLKKLILSFPFDKKMGIDELIKILNLNGEIYTIGDGNNDKTMLEAFEGYKMLFCYPSLYKTNAKVITSVHSLIKKIK